MRVYSKKIEGCGLLTDIAGTVVNKAIDLLPVELHIPGYQYCGPGTRLSKRLQRGDPGINKLDAACKTHDIAYSTYSDSANRAKADLQLANEAWERVKAKDSSLGEKTAAWAVTNIMKAKSKFGGGAKKKNTRKTKKSFSRKMKSTILRCVKQGKGLYLKPYKQTGEGIKKKKTRKVKRTKKR